MRRGRPLALGVLLTALLSPGAIGAGGAGAPELIAKAKAALSRGDRRGVLRLVARERAASYEAVDQLLNEGDSSSEAVVGALAGAYATAFSDRALLERAATFQGWSAAERAAHAGAIARKTASITALREGRYAEAGEGFEKARSAFHDLGDLREEGRCLSNLGATLGMTGLGVESLARLEEAVAVVRRSGDRGQLGAIEINRAYVLDDLGDLDAERNALLDAIAICHENGDALGEGSALATIGGLDLRLGRISESAEENRRGADIGRDLSDFALESAAWFNLAAVSERRGDAASSESAMRRSLEAARRGNVIPAEVDAMLRLATFAKGRGDYETGQRLIVEARAAVLRTDDAQMKSSVDYEEALLRTSQGQYAKALPLFASAEKLLEGTDALGRKAAVRGSRAVVLYYLGRYEEAAARLREAIEMSAAGGRPDLEASQRMSLGVFLSVMGESAAALAEIEKGAKLHRETGDAIGSAEDLDAIGSLRFKAGDLAGARAALEESIAGFPEGLSLLERAEAVKDLSMVEFASGPGRREAGLARLRQALEEFTALDDLEGIVHCGLIEADADLSAGEAASARAAVDRTVRLARNRRTAEFGWQIELMRGRVAEAAGDRAGAIRSYGRSVTEVERLRGSARPVPWRAAILDDRIAPYRALVRLHAATNDFERAYRMARAAKARTFIERMIPPRLEVEPAAKIAAPPFSFPEAAVSSGSFRSLLGPREAVLDYFFDDEKLDVFIVRRAGVTMRPLLRGDASLAGLIEAVRYPGRPGSAEAAVTESWARAARRLGELLLGPLAPDLAGSDHLLIVPNGALHGVPFAALEVAGRRVVDRWTVSTLPAAESLFSRVRSPSGRPPRTLALGDPASMEAPSRLAGAAEEARAVVALAGMPSDLALGPEARESLMKSRGGSYERIHVAAHARIDPVQPSRSCLFLAPGDGEDGRLEAGEIASMSIEAALVVLSGCGTAIEGGLARGNTPGDERAGLYRAFLAAGAGTVVAGSWEMDDLAARSFMPRLYTMLDGRTPAEALANLQRDLISGRITDASGRPLDHPFYWAGLAAYGAGTGTPPVIARAAAADEWRSGSAP